MLISAGSHFPNYRSALAMPQLVCILRTPPGEWWGLCPEARWAQQPRSPGGSRHALRTKLWALGCFWITSPRRHDKDTRVSASRLCLWGRLGRVGLVEAPGHVDSQSLAFCPVRRSWSRVPRAAPLLGCPPAVILSGASLCLSPRLAVGERIHHLFFLPPWFCFYFQRPPPRGKPRNRSFLQQTHLHAGAGAGAYL